MCVCVCICVCLFMGSGGAGVVWADRLLPSRAWGDPRRAEVLLLQGGPALWPRPAPPLHPPPTGPGRGGGGARAL